MLLRQLMQIKKASGLRFEHTVSKAQRLALCGDQTSRDGTITYCPISPTTVHRDQANSPS
jgi:hypothetical protein